MPHVVDLACGFGGLMAQRGKIVPLAEGEVVEIGIGTGRNLSFYDAARVRRVIGVNPADAMTRLARPRAAKTALRVEFLDASAEDMPLEAASADCVVITYTMCSIPDIDAALGEIGRILKPGGRLLLAEHGRSPRAGVARWQDRLTPAWKALAGGCHLNRDTRALVEGAGFRFERVECFALKGVPEIVGYHTVGVALKG